MEFTYYIFGFICGIVVTLVLTAINEKPKPKKIKKKSNYNSEYWWNQGKPPNFD
jgi:hypothetical protein